MAVDAVGETGPGLLVGCPGPFRTLALDMQHDKPYAWVSTTTQEATMAKMSKAQQANIHYAIAHQMREILTTGRGRDYLVAHGWARQLPGYLVPTLDGLIAAGVDMDAIHAEALAEHGARGAADAELRERAESVLDALALEQGGSPVAFRTIERAVDASGSLQGALDLLHAEALAEDQSRRVAAVGTLVHRRGEVGPRFLVGRVTAVVEGARGPMVMVSFSGLPGLWTSPEFFVPIVPGDMDAIHAEALAEDYCRRPRMVQARQISDAERQRAAQRFDVERVTRVRNQDRSTTCRSCRAAATVLICVDGKIYNSSCARHEALNMGRALAEVERVAGGQMVAKAIERRTVAAEAPRRATVTAPVTPKRQRYTRLSPAMQTAMAHAAKHGGVVEAWEIKTGTSVALIDRGILTTIYRCADGVKRQQLTDEGLNVATPRIDLDKLHEAALDEDDERSGGYGQPDGLLGTTEARQQEHAAAGLPGMCDPDVDHDHDPVTPGSLAAEVLDDEAERIQRARKTAATPTAQRSLTSLIHAYRDAPRGARLADEPSAQDIFHQISTRLNALQGIAEGMESLGYPQTSRRLLDLLNGTEH